MPMCSIKQCGARKSKNRPNLTLHSVPKNEVLRRKWRNAIGLENINLRHKELYICSLHFEESHLNRTLDVVRLRENAVPTVFNMPSTSKHFSHMIYTQKENLDWSPKMPPITEPVPVLCGNVNVHKEQVTAMSHQGKKLALTYETLPTSKNVPAFCETRNIQEKMKPKKYLLPAYDMPPITEPIPVLCDTNKYQESVVEYIAGFVCRKLSNNLKCDICLQLLSGEENKKSLIYLKSRGDLKYASTDVINIIKKAENVIKKTS